MGYHEAERPRPRIWFHLYVIIDIFSRKVIHWEAWPTETGILAAEFIEHAIEANGGAAPQAVQADRGTSMTSSTVAGLYARLGIDQSHSRPHVSNDNPFSEANLPGSGQGSHPPAPTYPYVNLSIYPARAVQSFGQYRSAQCANSHGARFRTPFSHWVHVCHCLSAACTSTEPSASDGGRCAHRVASPCSGRTR